MAGDIGWDKVQPVIPSRLPPRNGPESPYHRTHAPPPGCPGAAHLPGLRALSGTARPEMHSSRLLPGYVQKSPALLRPAHLLWASLAGRPHVKIVDHQDRHVPAHTG